jgi:hypothetical protein
LFSERLETLEIVEATTLKADGRRLPVDLTKVVTQLQPGVANMPIYGDLKGMVVIYPVVGAGAGISLTWRRHVHHPLCEIGQRLNVVELAALNQGIGNRPPTGSGVTARE